MTGPPVSIKKWKGSGRNASPPLGEHVALTTGVDANRHHDVFTGTSVTAVLHLVNQILLDLYTKRQAFFKLHFSEVSLL